MKRQPRTRNTRELDSVSLARAELSYAARKLVTEVQG